MNTNQNGYLAVAANGASFTLQPTTRTKARQAAPTLPRFHNTDVIGLVDLADLSDAIGALAKAMKIKDLRQLNMLVDLLGSAPERIVNDLFLELTARTLDRPTPPSIEPFEIDESKLAGLDPIRKACWHDNPALDCDQIVPIFEAASRAQAIKLPTENGERGTIALMPVGGRGEWPSHDLSIQMRMPGLSTQFGDLLPVEETDFFRTCVGLAGTEEGPKFGIAILNMVMFYAAIIYNDLSRDLGTKHDHTATGTDV